MTNINNDTVRNELVELIEKLGIKQRFLAKKFGLSDTTISYFMRDMRDLPMGKLSEIHNFCSENN